jgi:hypothetical protein
MLGRNDELFNVDPDCEVAGFIRQSRTAENRVFSRARYLLLVEQERGGGHGGQQERTSRQRNRWPEITK